MIANTKINGINTIMQGPMQCHAYKTEYLTH